MVSSFWHGSQWPPPPGHVLAYALPDLGCAGPSHLLLTNRNSKNEIGFTSVIRSQKTSSLLVCFLSLSLLLLAVFGERTTWQGTEGYLKPIACKDLRPRVIESCLKYISELGSRSRSSWTLRWLQPGPKLWSQSYEKRNPESEDPPKLCSDSWSIGTME